MKTSRFRLMTILGIGLLADQVSKRIALGSGIAHFNTGMSLGVSLGNHILSVTLIVVLIILFTIWTKNNARCTFSAWLLVTGALSNVIDRFQYGAVVDWLTLPLLGLKNNLADWFIAIGVLGLILSEWQSAQKKVVKKKKK